MRKLFALLAALPASLLAASSAPGDTLDHALADARSRQAAVFIDFSAVWCHSCYFMEKNVMNGAEWDAVKKRAVVIELDADSPEGSYWAKQFKIGGWPTYVVLDAKGDELGRILGDRTRPQFYRELQPILTRASTLSLTQEQALVGNGSPASIAAARSALKALYERQDYDGATSWLASLPADLRATIAKDRTAQYLIDRIALLRATKAHDAPACLAAAPAVIGEKLSCDVLLEVSEFQSCLPEGQLVPQLSRLAPKMEALQQAVLVKGTEKCNDTRGVVETAVDLYDALHDDAAKARVLDQGVKYSERKLAGKYTSDRNLADNLRFYRELQENDAALDALYPKLIKAYPDDYVYAYRWGKALARRGQFDQALPLLEQSAPKSYGRNRLWVTMWRAYTLKQLKRDDEANRIAAEVLQANGPWFESDVADIKSVLDGKAPS